MPRDASGNYTLPAGNPVITGTTITANWANTTMPDIGNELTNSLDRNGRGGMLAPMLFDDGSQVSPAITFTSEVTLGIYRESAGNMGVAAGGNPQARFNDVNQLELWRNAMWTPVVTADGSVSLASLTVDPGPILVGDGSAAAPAYAFVNTPGMGLFRAAADIIGFATAGTERMRLTDLGNLLLGGAVDDGSNTLQVTGSGDFTGSVVAGINLQCVGNLIADNVAGTNRTLLFRTSGSRRWQQACDTGAESGGNAGSDWRLSAFSDAGTILNDPIVITRATGQVAFITGPVVGANNIWHDGLNSLGGAHTITGKFTFTTNPEIKHTAPRMVLDNTNAAAEEGAWRFEAATSTFIFMAETDGGLAGDHAIRLTRTGSVLTGMELMRNGGGPVRINRTSDDGSGAKLQVNGTINDSNGIVTSSADDTVRNIIGLTQAEYDLLTPVATTLYLING